MGRLLLVTLLAAGCITGQRVRERDNALLREIDRQDRWAEDALQNRAAPVELDHIRQGDFEAVAAGRKQLRRLLQAVDRGTWIRDAVIEARREGETDPALLQTFDRAGAMRRDAAAAADEVADALADARGGLTMADLRPGFDALRKASESDSRLPRDLRPAPLPVPRPLISAAGKVLHQHPEAAKELDRLPPDDATQVRALAAQADLANKPPPEPQKPPQPSAEEPQPPPMQAPGEQQAEAPSDTLNVSQDVRDTLAKRGTPRAFVARPDGLFGLRYDDVEVVFDPSGRKVREEPTH